MDYHLTVPLLPGLRRPVFDGDAGEMFSRGGPELRLRVWGREDDFHVGWDRQRTVVRGGQAKEPAATAPGSTSTAGGGGESRQPARVLPSVRPVPPKEKKPAEPQPGEYFEF
jgi:hypothetical protein